MRAQSAPNGKRTHSLTHVSLIEPYITGGCVEPHLAGLAIWASAPGSLATAMLLPLFPAALVLAQVPGYGVPGYAATYSSHGAA